MSTVTGQHGLQREDVIIRGTKALITIDFPSLAAGFPKGQLGYFVAPNLIATCWHPSLLPLLTAKSKYDVRLGFQGRTLPINRVLANTQADCVLLQLQHAVPDACPLELGTIWEANRPQVVCWSRPAEQPQVVSHEAALELGHPQEYRDSGLSFLPLRKRFGAAEMLRGSPVLSARSGLCLGHAVGSPISEDAHWVCPSYWVSLLAPFAVPFHNRLGPASRAGLRRRHLSGRDKILDVLVFSACPQDHEELRLVEDLHCSPSNSLPGLRIQAVLENQHPAQLPEGCILLFVLEPAIEKAPFVSAFYSSILDSKRPQVLWASVLADRVVYQSFGRIQQSGFQVSAERPLRWIIDRGRRLAAWATVLEQIRLQAACVRLRQHQARKA